MAGKRRRPKRLTDHEKAVIRILGFPGAMIAHSKTGFAETHPDEVAIFNANVVVAELCKVWHGDYSLTRNHPRLTELAAAIHARVYLLYESDARFDAVSEPRLHNAVAWVDPGSGIQLNPHGAIWHHGQITWTHPRKGSKRWRPR